MRTTTRLCLVISIVAAVGVAAVPVAQRSGTSRLCEHQGLRSHKKADKKQNKKIKKAHKKAERAHERIADLKEWNFSLSDWNNSQQKTIELAPGTVGAIVAGALTGARTSGLVALQARSRGAASRPPCADIEDALNDRDHGSRRPEPGAAAVRRVRVLAGERRLRQVGRVPVNGTDPPTRTVIATRRQAQASARPARTCVDFNNDVSPRMYSVNVFPGSRPGRRRHVRGDMHVDRGGALAARRATRSSAGTGNTSHALVNDRASSSRPARPTGRRRDRTRRLQRYVPISG